MGNWLVGLWILTNLSYFWRLFAKDRGKMCSGLDALWAPSMAFLNQQEARALLGRLEYQEGSVEAAFCVFEGIDVEAVTANIRISMARRCGPQRHGFQSSDAPPMSMHAISLLCEAIFLKAKSLQALGRLEETVVDAALEQTGKWDRAQLLRTKAKLQIAQGHTKNAIQTYAHLLAALQVQKKTFGIRKKLLNRWDQDRTLEMETWHDLTNIYTSLSQWPDAEVCLSKTEVLSPHSASSCHSRGLLYQAKGLNKEAQKFFWEALDKEPTHVTSLISMAKILIQRPGDQFLHVARSLLRQAICLDRTNHLTWHTLGLLHKLEPVGASAAEAAECFEAAALLEETAPVEPFR